MTLVAYLNDCGRHLLGSFMNIKMYYFLLIFYLNLFYCSNHFIILFFSCFIIKLLVVVAVFNIFYQTVNKEVGHFID